MYTPTLGLVQDVLILEGRRPAGLTSLLGLTIIARNNQTEKNRTRKLSLAIRMWVGAVATSDSCRAHNLSPFWGIYGTTENFRIDLP